MAKTAIRITLLEGSGSQDEAKMSPNLEVLGHLGSKLGGLGVIFGPSCNVLVQLGSKLEVLKPSWLKVGGSCGYVGSKLGPKFPNIGSKSPTIGPKRPNMAPKCSSMALKCPNIDPNVPT